MAYDERLVERVRRAIGDRAGVEEKRMFGGVAFMIHNRMTCGVVGSSLMVRVEPAEEPALLRERGVRPMDFTGRPMHGFLFVDPPAVKSAVMLRNWIDRAITFVESRRGKPDRVTKKRIHARKQPPHPAKRRRGYGQS